MSKEKKLIPELRFPEFVKGGKWEEKKLGAIGEPLMCKRIFKEQTTIDPKNGIPFYKIGTFGRIADSYISQKLYEKYKSEYSFPKLGDILISASGTIGRIVIYDGSPAYFQDSNIVWLGNDEQEVLNSFLFYSYSTLKWQTSDGGVISRLYNSDLKNMEILFPKEKDEQQKIASCLSSLDEVIAAHSQKLELLNEHKKGLMQNLFPQGGEKVPKYRFKKFEKDGMWVEKTIDTVKSILTDYVANGSFQSLRENLNVVDSVDYAFYVRLTDLRAGLGHSNQKYVDESTYKFLNKSALYGGELLMANIGANVGEVWQMPNVNKPATLAPNMIMIKFKKDIDSEFVYQYLTSDIGVANISSVISGSGHPKISKTDLRQVKVILPPRIEEQQKIASCLSSIDALITAQAEKIEQLQMHKKGLMQGLFPEIND